MPMTHVAKSVVMARYENMTWIKMLIYLQSYEAVVFCDGYIGILLWTSYVKTAAARTVYYAYGRARLAGLSPEALGLGLGISSNELIISEANFKAEGQDRVANLSSSKK